MQIMKLFSSRINLVIALFTITVSFGIVSNPRKSLADITVTDYCTLAIQNMQQEVSNLQEMIAIANQYQNDPTTLAQQEAVKRAEFDQAKIYLYSAYGISANEYVTYQDKYKRQVDQYLADNPYVKSEMDYQISEINRLLGDYEALKGLPDDTSTPPPLPVP